MKAAIKISLLFSIIGIIVYLSLFARRHEIPIVSSDIPFLGITFPWKISRLFDLIMIFPFLFSIMMLIKYSDQVKNENHKLHRLIKIGLIISLTLTIMLAIQISLLAGIIAGLSLCFLFGLGSLEFGLFAGIVFYLVTWIFSSYTAGLLLGFLPGLSAGLIFGSTALLAFGLRSVISQVMELMNKSLK